MNLARLRAAALRWWRGEIRPLLILALVLCSIRSSLADWNSVPTGSMKPTILAGDRIFVNKLAYDLKVPFAGWQTLRWGGPRRGDVVICYSPEDETRLVKRVIGLPGDRIEMCDNRLIINGEPVLYEALATDVVDQIDRDERPRHAFASERLDDCVHPVMSTPGVPARRSMAATAIPAGQYLVLGDNRDLSRDSRWFGLVSRESIAGRVFGVAFSLDRNRWYVPRWRRFLRGMR